MAKKFIYNRAEIRYELYELRNKTLEWKNQHLAAFGTLHSESASDRGSRKPCGHCHVCDHYDGLVAGIERAIREFGGKPR
jgi:hypothetical protein